MHSWALLWALYHVCSALRAGRVSAALPAGPRSGCAAVGGRVLAALPRRPYLSTMCYPCLQSIQAIVSCIRNGVTAKIHYARYLPASCSCKVCSVSLPIVACQNSGRCTHVGVPVCSIHGCLNAVLHWCKSAYTSVPCTPALKAGGRYTDRTRPRCAAPHAVPCISHQGCHMIARRCPQITPARSSGCPHPAAGEA